MGKGAKNLLDKLKSISKEQLVVILLVGVLLVIIAIPTGNNSITEERVQEANTVTHSAENENTSEEMERRLVKVLENVKGVGQVDVMLTKKASGEKIVEKDMPVTGNKTEESDSEGGVRTSQESSTGEETVYIKGEDGSQTPYVVKELEPEVAGVLVVAEGGDNPVIVKNITDAVMSLFSIEVHKIKVMKMN